MCRHVKDEGSRMTSSDERPPWVAEYERLKAEDLSRTEHVEHARTWQRLGRLLGKIGIALGVLAGLLVLIGFGVLGWVMSRILG